MEQKVFRIRVSWAGVPGLGLELGLVASVHRRTRYNTEFFTGAENAKRDSTGTEK